MAQQNTFDITSSIDHAEVANAINQAMKEVHTRFDFKGSKSNIEVEGAEAITLTSDDDYKLKALNDILQSKFVRRGVPLKGLTYGKVEQALGGTVRQRVTLQQGIPQDKAKRLSNSSRTRNSKCRSRFRATCCASRARTGTPCRKSSPPCAPTTSALTCSSPITDRIENSTAGG